MCACVCVRACLCVCEQMGCVCAHARVGMQVFQSVRMCVCVNVSCVCVVCVYEPALV